MSGKFYVGLGLLVALLLFGLLTGFWVQNVQENVAADVMRAAGAKDLQEGQQLIRQANEHWSRYRNAIASCSHHAAIEEIDSLFLQLPLCDQNGFLLGCTRLCSLLDVLADEHTLTLWNFL